jgi:hypothetical protein
MNDPESHPCSLNAEREDVLHYFGINLVSAGEYADVVANAF